MEMAVKITFNAVSANNNCPHNRKSRMQLTVQQQSVIKMFLNVKSRKSCQKPSMLCIWNSDIFLTHSCLTVEY